ncbi:MRPL3 [Candida oxycetoniae]|uniref:MRPL3 n=1 Tax=Candida oxycetoniae TaxID=497107 RepID=A0AAI9SZ46_9ASCO|nr:MRPL3 [Candida oxycetoniae]KAI3405841.2 MRPL3 [Candida oxycetoniae]
MLRQITRFSNIRLTALLNSRSTVCSLHKSTRTQQESIDTQTSSTSISNGHIASSNEYTSNLFIHRLPESTAEQSPLLVTLHNRLNLSSKFKLNTLSQCLNMLPTSKSDGLANNFGLNTIGKTLLSYYVTEYLLIYYPRLPMSIHNAAVDSLMGIESLSSMGRSWGIEVDEISKLDRFLGQESEFLKYGRLRYMDDEKKDNKIRISGIEEVAGSSPRQQNWKQEDIAYASAVRSIIGGIYTHCNEEAAKEFIKDHILSRKIPLTEMFEFSQPVAELVRLCDKLELKEPLSIRLIAETGRLSAHPQFLAGVFVGNEKLGEGIGSSITEAQIRASINSLLAYYLYSPITSEGDQVKVPSDKDYKFEGIIGSGDVAI